MHITEATLIKTHLIVASRQEEIGRNKIHFSLSGYGFLAHGHAYDCSHVSLRAKHEDGNTKSFTHISDDPESFLSTNIICNALFYKSKW